MVILVLTKRERLALAIAYFEIVLCLKPKQCKRKALSFLIALRCAVPQYRRRSCHQKRWRMPTARLVPLSKFVMRSFMTMAYASVRLDNS